MSSEDLGPYRIEDRLGSGGMGEVYRAYDRRLDRWVAIKIIRADAAVGESGRGEKARERFRREARAAAGLSHPTVVQIHDILEREDGSDCIVMELVEGETLAQILARGPLELDRAVRLGREIAEGLAAAHARGIVHRDLKAENVMITAEDHPKILDFGLAKQLFAAPEASLSVEGRVVGTSHAMSPEQAQGFRVDHRSDLFSLGTLLYEMLTARSPFRRPSLAETLTRVCIHVQEPVAELRPEVPAELSNLVDRLLAKKPEDRPQDAGEVVVELRHLEPAVSASMDPISQPTLIDLPRASATGSAAVSVRRSSTGASLAAGSTSASRKAAGGLSRALPVGEGTESRWFRTAEFVRRPVAWLSGLAVIAVATVSVVLLRPAPPPPIEVAVPQPTVAPGSGAPAPELLSASVRVALLEGLLGLDGVHTFAPDQVDAVQVDGSEGSSQQIARALAADEVVTSRLACAGSECRATLDRVGTDGILRGTESFEVPSSDLLLVSIQVIERLRHLYADHPVRPDTPGLEIGPEDYEEFLRVRELYRNRGEEVTLEELLDRLATLRKKAPRFLPVYVLEANAARILYTNSRDPKALERAMTAIEAARELAPNDPQPVLAQVDAALDSQQLEIAANAVEELERLLPGSPLTRSREAAVEERRGDRKAALGLLREVAHERPSTKNLFDLANMEIRQGETAAALEDLETLVRLHPADFGARKLLAQIELYKGSPARAAELYEELLRRSPETGLVSNLGLAYLLLQRYEPAVECFRRAWQADPRSPFAVLNLADAELMQGRREDAETLYRQVIELIDHDPAGNWQYPIMKAQALAHLGHARQAAALVQRALQSQPDNPEVAYEAAVVYAVVGDSTSALVNVERALDSDFDPRWFGFPWFDGLRSHPDFQALFKDKAAGVP